MAIENPDRAFHNESIKVAHTHLPGKCRSQAVEKIEDSRFFDLNIFALLAEQLHQLFLFADVNQKSDQQYDEESGENGWPHNPVNNNSPTIPARTVVSPV